jgi:16S rRNA (guanine527-N7)-methyltransferase
MHLGNLIRRGLDAQNLALDDKSLDQLSFYVRELGRWNKRMNLVGLRTNEAIVTELLYDALFLFKYIRQDGSVVDMGSGAGILAVPVSILGKGITVYSVDKSLKKIRFQRHLQRSVGLENFIPLHARIEDLDALGVDSVMAKAFGSIQHTLDKGASHVKEGGHIYMVKGRLESPVDREGFVLEQTVEYTLPLSEKPCRLFVYRKV